MSDATMTLAATFGQIWPERPAPVGMARVDAIPEGVELVGGGLASACALWRLGTDRVVARGADHGACVIGLVTQGFAASLPADDPTLGAMLQVEYIDPSEVPLIPTLRMGHAAIVYGPLGRMPVEPEAVLVFATAAQAMLLAEGLGLMRAGAGGLPMSGRPTCMAIPAAIAAGDPRGSLACTGARIYAGFGPDELLVVLPAAAVGGLDAELRRLWRANLAVQSIAEANLTAATAA